MICEVCTINPAIQKHHISYFPEETRGVCDECHKRIHSGQYPELTKQYIKYKPGDAKLFYSQKRRIDGFLTYLSRK